MSRRTRVLVAIVGALVMYLLGCGSETSARVSCRPHSLGVVYNPTPAASASAAITAAQGVLDELGVDAGAVQ